MTGYNETPVGAGVLIISVFALVLFLAVVKLFGSGWRIRS
jgi:hypothetical protein